MAEQHERDESARAASSSSLPPQQLQGSRQSSPVSGEPHGADDRKSPQSGTSGAEGEGSQPGIGSSQAQDREAPVRDRDGTADIERGSQPESDPGSRESLVQDPTGAYKERP
jgi:hypothetical protein